MSSNTTISPVPQSSWRKVKRGENSGVPFDYQLYECIYQLRLEKFDNDPGVKTNIQVRHSCFQETNNRTLLVLVCSNNCLLLQLRETGALAVTKQLNWFQNPSRHIVDVCIDPLRGSWVLCVCKDSSLYLIPALAQLKDSSKVVNACSTWSHSDLSRIPLGKPIKGIPCSIVWWHTLDDRNICILASDIGELIFFDLSLHQEVCRTFIKTPINKIELCQDINERTSYLFIYTEKSGTLQLMLEQPSQNATFTAPSSLTPARDMGYDMVAECNTESILTVDSANKDDMQIQNKIEAHPSDFKYGIHYAQDQVLIVKHDVKYHILEVYSDLKRVPEYVYQLPTDTFQVSLTDHLIFTFSEIQDKVQLNVLSRQFSATSFRRQGTRKPELTHEAELQSFPMLEGEHIIDCYMTSFHRPVEWEAIFPHSLNKKEDQVRLFTFIIVTNVGVLYCRPRVSPEAYFTDLAVKADISIAEKLGITLGLNVPLLCEYVADKLICEKDVQSAIKFYNLSKCSAMKRATNLVECASVTDGLIFIKQILKRQPSNLSNKERKQLSNMAMMCYIEQAMECQKTSTFAKNLADSFKAFVTDNFDYDEELAMDLLVSYGMFNNLFELAKARGRIQQALEKLAAKAFYMLPSPVQDLLLDGGYAETVCETCNGVFIDHMEPIAAVKFLLMEPDVTKKLVLQLSRRLPQLDETTLLQVCRVFDPSRQFIKFYLEKADCLARKRSNSITSLSSSSSTVLPDDAALFPTVTQMINLFLKAMIMLNSKRSNVYLPNLKHIMRHFIGQRSWTSTRYSRNSSSAGSWDAVNELTKVPLGCGSYHIAFVASDNDLYTWGLARNGRLGHGDIIEERGTSIPLRVEGLHMHGIQVMSVSCGIVHTVALCREGVYAWGGNQFGQLGVGDTRKRSRPVNVPHLMGKQIVSIVCGHYHTLALTSDAKVWAWGWAIHGQLGLESVENRYTPVQIMALKEMRIVQIAAGYAHSAVLTSKGEVFTFGAGLYGQLGIGSNTKCTTPQYVSSLQYDSIYLIACGAFETLAVSDEQTIFVWGRNYKQYNICSKADNAQYGRQMASKAVDISHRYLPEDLPYKIQNQSISQLVCGNWHYMALTTTGFLYTWGCNDCGQLGHYNIIDQPQPRNVRALSRKSIVHIAAGGEFSLAVDCDGQVLAWGKADAGQLGIEADGSSQTSRRSNMSILAPTPVPNLPISFDRVSITSANSMMKQNVIFDQDRGLPDLSSVGESSSPYGVESVLISLFKLMDLYKPIVIEKYALSLKQWFTASFCNELQGKWDKAFEYRLKSLELQHSANKDCGDILHHLLLVVGDLLSKIEDHLSEEVEEDTHLVAMVTCILEILDYWIKADLPFSKLEEIFLKHLQALTPILTLVFFGFHNKGHHHNSTSMRFALYRVSQPHKSASKFSDGFFVQLLAHISEELEKGSDWYTFLSGEMAANETKMNVVSAQQSEMSTDRMVAEILEHKRKILNIKPYISLSSANVTTFAAASASPTAQLQSSDMWTNQKQPELTVFTCSHNLLHYYMLETVIPEFRSRMAELPEPLPQTAEVMACYYQQPSQRIPAACPCCVYNNLRQEQLQFLRDTGVDLLQNRSSLWEV